MHEEKLSEAKVKDIMNVIVKNPTLASPNETITEVLKKILADTRSRHAYIVNEKGILIGSLRVNNIIAYLFPSVFFIEEYASIPVSSFVEYTNAKMAKDIMNNDPQYVYENTSLKEMVKTMLSEKVNELPVVDKNKKVIGEVNVMELIAFHLNANKIGGTK